MVILIITVQSEIFQHSLLRRFQSSHSNNLAVPQHLTLDPADHGFTRSCQRD